MQSATKPNDLACPARLERAIFASEEIKVAIKFNHFNDLQRKTGYQQTL